MPPTVGPRDGDSDTSDVAASFNGVTFSYDATVAVRDVTLRLARGESVALLGANGSGKTTLLSLLAGLLKPDVGTVEVAAPPKRISYVLQHHQAGSSLPVTVAEVVRMGRYGHRGLLGRLDAEDRAAVTRAVERTEVGDLLGRPYGQLSGGQRQRVLLAQALAAEPRLLLLDEPITGLDLASQERILQILDEETSGDTTVVMTTHHLDEARHCDVAVLLATTVVAAGPPDRVLTAEHLRTAYAGRVLGDHRGHDHAHELLVLDDHGHGRH